MDIVPQRQTAREQKTSNYNQMAKTGAQVGSAIAQVLPVVDEKEKKLADIIRKRLQDAGSKGESSDDILIQRFKNKYGNDGYTNYLNRGDEYLKDIGYIQKDEAGAKTAAAIGAGATLLGATYGVGAGLSAGGKWLYGLGVRPTPELAERIVDAKTAIEEDKYFSQKMIDQNKQVISTSKDPKAIAQAKQNIKDIEANTKALKEAVPETAAEVGLRTKGAYGLRTRVGTKLKASAAISRDKYVAPAFEKLNAAKKTINMPEILTKAENMAANYINSIGGADTNKEVVKVWNKIKKNYDTIGDITYDKANAIKSGIDKLTAEAVAKGKVAETHFKQLKSFIANALRGKIHAGLQEVDETGKALQEYKTYGTRKAGGVIAKKALTETALGNPLQVSAVTTKGVGTPITTIGGKILHNVGNIMKFIPEKAIEYGIKGIKATGKMAKGLLEADPTGILSDIIQNELYGKDLKGGQNKAFIQYRLQGMDAEKAAQEAKKIDPEKKLDFA